MEKKKVTFFADLGWCGCNDEQTLEVDASMTDKELDNMAWEMACEWSQSWEGDERLMSEEEWDELEPGQFEAEFVSGWWELTDASGG